MSANLERASAGRNLLIYAALVAAVAGYTVLLWNERPEIESFRYPTGLGDGEMVDLVANPPDPLRPLAVLDGVAYIAVSKPKRPLDRHMVKVARDDADQYYFYQFSEAIGGGDIDEDGDLYLKVDPDYYIKVGPAENGAAAAAGGP
ncbi:MAG: hypothetical protein ACR2RV_26940 [Verrucomicrobiales bacterium]